MVTETEKATVIAAVQQGSHRWQTAFNQGDAATCAAAYEPTAVMQARPMGTFTGTAEIQAFWQQLMTDGFTHVEYLEPKIQVLDATSAVLSSPWRMNKASGLIHRELWVLQPDGTAKLREDDFEVTG